LGIYYLGFALLSRATFGIIGALGGVCSETSPVETLSAAKKFNFVSTNLCAASGLKLQEGARYRIEVNLSSDWKDSNIDADGEGIPGESVTWPMNFAVPFRRWLKEPWFKPIARIGAEGSDEYPLIRSVPVLDGISKEQRRVLASEIVARRDGELFIYVNDAVFFWPWFHTYDNNHGTATVTIQRIETPAIQERQVSEGEKGSKPISES
jgi:hypothetical protein